jgi:sugar lactone lactonase YvrE
MSGLIRSTAACVLLLVCSGSAQAVPEKIYWVDAATGEVNRADGDGSNVENLASATNPNGLALDLVNGRMYWVECCAAPNGALLRANLDGSGAAPLTTTDFGFPQRVAVDPAGGKVYWSDSSNPSISSANLDGSGQGFVLQSPDVAVTIGLAVDGSADKLYWSQGFGSGSEGIYRADLDGGNIESLVTATGGDPISNPQGLALDPAGGKMYWTDLGNDTIRRADLDGSNVELVANNASAGLQNPIGIAVDPVEGKLYWSDTTTDKIQRSNLDGTNVEDVLTSMDGLSFVRALALDPAEAPGVPALSLSGQGLLVAALIAASRRRLPRGRA